MTFAYCSQSLAGLQVTCNRLAMQINEAVQSPLVALNSVYIFSSQLLHCAGILVANEIRRQAQMIWNGFLSRRFGTAIMALEPVEASIPFILL